MIMSNVDYEEYRLKNCVDFVPSIVDHHEHANFVISEIKKGNIFVYENTDVGDGIFRVLGFAIDECGLSVVGREYPDMDFALDGNWRSDDNLLHHDFEDMFTMAKDIKFVSVSKGTYDKKHKESVKLTNEQWEAINSAVEDYCLRLSADGEHDYLEVMQDAQKALLEELGQCE